MKETEIRISRRGFIKLAGLAAASASLAACGSLPGAENPDSSPVQLVYQDWRTDWFPTLAQEMLKKFNEEHPNIKVFYTADPENLEEQMASDMLAGTAPDVLAGCCEFFPAWANAGYLLDLRDYVNKDLEQSTIDDWSKAQYQALFTRDGRQFGLPKYHGALALFYNKDLFDKAGVDYPTGDWDHEDYLQAMQQLTLRSGNQTTQWGSMFDVAWERIQMHVNGWGGHFVDPENPSKCVMAESAAVNAMEWLRARIWDDRVMATFLDVQTNSTRRAFVDQKVVMVEDGSWALKDILDTATFRVGVAPFPAGPERRVTLATTDGFGIYAQSKHPAAAWQLLKFLVSQDYGRAMARAHFLQPARRSLVPDWVDYIRQEYPEKTRELNIEAFADGQIKGYSVSAEIFPNMVGVGKIAKDTWDQIFTFGKAPVAAIEEVCQQIEALQDRFTSLPASCECEAKDRG